MTAPVPEDDLVTLIEAQELVAQAFVAQAVGAVGGLAGGFGDWYSTPAIGRLTGQMGAILGAVSRQVAATTDAYVSQAVSAMTGKRFSPVGTRRTPLGRVGVTREGLLGRIADTYRWQQSQVDNTFAQAVELRAPSPPEIQSPRDAAMERLERVTSTELQLTQRNQAQATMGRAEERGLITGYRRVIHPELSTTGTCGLCIAASTRVYRVAELMPLHPGCHCLPMPMTKSRDPGGAINAADFRQLYRDAGGTEAEKLRNTRYKIDEHGELGPVIRPADEPIRSEQQAARDANKPPRRPKTPEERLATLRNKRERVAAAVAKAEELVSSTEVDQSAWAISLDAQRQRLSTLDREIAEAA